MSEPWGCMCKYCQMDGVSCPKGRLKDRLHEAQALAEEMRRALEEIRDAVRTSLAPGSFGVETFNEHMRAKCGAIVDKALSLAPADVLKRLEADERGQRLLKWLDDFEAETEALPVQHETPELGCCTYNWRMRFIQAAGAALEEVDKP